MHSIQALATLLGGLLHYICCGYFLTIGSFVPVISTYWAQHNPRYEMPAYSWIATCVFFNSGIFMGIGGILAQKVHFKISLVLSSSFVSIGLILSNLTLKSHSVLFVFTYCVMYGAGMGLTVSVTVQTVAMWFPNNKGLVMGILTSGLGGGALLFGQMQRMLALRKTCKSSVFYGVVYDCVNANHLPSALQIMGSFNFVLQTDLDDDLGKPRQYFSQLKCEEKNISPRKLFSKVDFYLLWLTEFFCTIPVLTFISFYKILGTEHKLDPTYVSRIDQSMPGFVMLTCLTIGILSDKLSFKILFLLNLIGWSTVQFLVPILLRDSTKKIGYAAIVWFIFSFMASYSVLCKIATARLYGTKNFGYNVAIIGTGFAPGANIFIIMHLYMDLDKYAYNLYRYGGILLVLATICILLMDDPFVPKPLSWINFFSKRIASVSCRKRKIIDSPEVIIARDNLSLSNHK